MKNCGELNTDNEMDAKLMDMFDEKRLPEGFQQKLLNSLQDITVRTANRKKVLTGRFKAISIAAAVLIVILIPFSGKTIFTRLSNVVVPQSSGKTADMPMMIRLEGTDYIASQDVVTDDRAIGQEIGKVKKTIKDEFGDTSFEEATATALPVGTPIYSLKGMDRKTAVAAKYMGTWIIYKAAGEKRTMAPLYNEDYANAKKIVASYSMNNREVKQEITDKNSIQKIAEFIKNAKSQDESPSYANEKQLIFYFYNEDDNGIGKIADIIHVNFNDPALGGYISYDKYYKITPDIMKLLIPESIEGGYDAKLGGKRQIYEIYASPKLLIRRYIKDEGAAPPEIKVLYKGEKLFRDGKLTEDNLAGNYKLAITMKDTTIQDKVKKQFEKEYGNITGALSASISTGEDKNTTVMYIGFDKTPHFEFQEYGESVIIVLLDK